MQNRMNAKAGEGANRQINPRYTILICMSTDVKIKKRRGLLGRVIIKIKTMMWSWGSFGNMHETETHFSGIRR